MTRRILGASALYLLAMLGAAVIVLQADIPAVILEQTGLGEQAVKLLSLLNNAVIIGIAVLVGALTAHRVGLQSLIAHGWDGAPARLATFPIYALVGVLLGLGVVLADQWSFANIPALASLAETADQQVQGAAPSLAARFLYGGITEEVLLRWGMLSLFAWVIWAVTKNRRVAFFIAIPIAALLFGAGHLPILYTTLETVPVEMVIRVIALNAVLGVAYGVIYMRNSLEAAMITHAATHVGMLGGASILT